jgi:hypothetical protein
MQLWHESRGEAYKIPQDNWDYPKEWSSKYFLNINCIHAANRGVCMLLHTAVL